MQLVMNQPGMDSFQVTDDLMVLVACADFTRGEEICALLERAGSNVRAPGRLIHAWWNFESLAVPALRQVAVGEAARADLIILITQDAPSLPEPVIDWISLWLGMKEGGPQALVALLDLDAGRDEISPRILSQLKGVAGMGQMELFAEGLDGELEAVLNLGVRAVLRRQQEARAGDAGLKGRRQQQILQG